MGERIGNVYDGVISGVTEWGLYVEINENKCEGMVSMRDLGNDYYEFDEKNYCLIGRRHHQKFSLGDPIQIKVARANLEKKQLDFVLADNVLTPDVPEMQPKAEPVKETKKSGSRRKNSKKR